MPELVKSKTFIAYIIAKLRSTSVWSLADRIIKYARRFMLVGRILRYISIAFTVIETSAVLILSAAVIAVLLPIMFIALVSFYIAEIIIGGRIMRSREMCGMLSRKQIYIISQAGDFGEGLAVELSRGGAAVFVITASLNKRFISAEQINGVYYIRHAFFFRLKRRMLEKNADKLIYLM